MSSVKRIMVFNIENAEISDDAELSRLVQMMYNLPEAEFYLFLEKGASLTSQLRKAMDGHILHCTQTDLEIFRHPDGGRGNFIKIHRGKELFDWERVVTASSKEFVRFTIVLSELKRRELEIQQHLQAAQAQQSKNPLILEPNFNGIGISLPRLWALVKSWFRR
ncbi:hypothetical protein QTH91_05825 [Variovorax dokdonensis]|uniref:Uncharacterized protein n=1 Tax=Variovorax dokdonensis TaxID=344883 RepID=A0ABT7N7T9_9BURK|nr:hypothetical protein [Variovorax dokdonensis]MDM0043992.1 hypothetical protein [Variovorax dokdonensis]